ncbi:MAG: hypothetical protein JNK79_18875 [Chitinophagaceae bacterium]|nr:hypothetical protein [Chitinophagaceae bacterium]
MRCGADLRRWPFRTSHERNTSAIRLLVFLFHGVGGGHSMDVSLDAHSKLLHYLEQNDKNIWNATMLDVAKFAINKRR